LVHSPTTSANDSDGYNGKTLLYVDCRIYEHPRMFVIVRMYDKRRIYSYFYDERRKYDK